LSVQGLAISAGTIYPEEAYALVKFLTGRSELASNMFSATPARYSLASSVEQSTNQNNGGPGGGQGGPGGFGGMSSSIPDEIKPTFDQGLNVGLPISELRYASYLSNALTEMGSNGGDALSALQAAEAQAITDVQTAQGRNGTISLYIIPPEPEPTLATGEIELTCAVNLGFGGRGPGNQFQNQDQWDQVIADFVASDPDVGIVTLESVQDSDLSRLTADYDCIILPSNVVADSDLSTVLSLDPLFSNDSTFDPNDIIGSALSQLQQDNKTWALPLAIEPEMLVYDAAQFAQAGVPEPTNGWTVDQFVDALKMLKPYDTDPVPFQPRQLTGSSMLMIIGAFGGLPIDYRTDPATINFTDPATVDAIRQVLDLAAQGYIAYSSEMMGDPSETVPAITTNSLNEFRRPGRPGEGSMEDTTVTTTYPQGSQYSVISYNITTGYISASSQNPEAAYRFLSQVARNPQLFSGMPVRQSLLNDPTVMASQGEEIVAVYQQIDALLRNPNTIVFPTISGGGGMGAVNFMQEYWLRQVLENYLTNGADLETELADAEMTTKAYAECLAGIVVDTASGDAGEQRRQYAEQVMACVTSVDPDFSLGD
jgi:ABC-type glycerol-3-phosphate transport system substrate-binding protein